MASESPDSILIGLHEAGVEHIVVGGTAAVLLGAPIVTEDLDIVHRRTPENVDCLLEWLTAHQAYHRFDLANRKLPPTREVLLGSGHVNLQTTLGKLDVLCELEPGKGYEELLPDTVFIDEGPVPLRVLDLPRLIAAKSAAGRAKDRAVLPLLVATLDERRKK